MKRIAFTFLATSLALMNFAAAEDEQPAPVARRQAAPPARSLPPQAQRSMPARPQQQSFRPQQNVNVSPRFQTQIPNQPRFGGPRLNGDASRPRIYQPTAPRTRSGAQTNTGVPATTTPHRDWRGRGTNDWSRNTTTTTTTDPSSTAAQPGRDGDWRNRRTGTQDGSSAYTGSYRGRSGNWNHDRTHHRRDWWTSRYNRFSRFGGGYYYWDSGYWYPAYGYDPYFSTYTYDAPIYSYNDQDPAQVMMGVQTELARRGYYNGSIDGTYGPQTREALLRYQNDNGLATTGTVDQPTLESLGYQ